jgi:hypothetical protein
MAVLLAPATVTITNQTGVATLTAVRAMIGVPSARDQQAHGGIIRYAVLIDPLTALNQCRDGYLLYITSNPPHVVDSTTQYYIYEQNPVGSGGLAAHKLLVSNRRLSG